MITKSKRNKYDKNRLLILGTIPFGKNTYDFLRSFGSNVSLFDTNYRNWWRIPYHSLLYIFMLLKNDVIYKIGYFRPSAPYYLIARILKKKIVVHWIGSEVLNLKRAHFWTLHGSYSVSNQLTSELASFNIHATWLPLYFPIVSKSPTNQKISISSHGVLVYLVKNREVFYGLRYLLLLANTFKNIPFYVVGSSDMVFSNENILNMGYLSEQALNDLFDRITLYIRITEHDGLSQLMLRSLLFGKDVITNTEHPYVNFFNTHSSNDTDLIRLVSQIFNNKPRINNNGIDYVNDFYKPYLQFKRYQSAFEKIGIKL